MKINGHEYRIEIFGGIAKVYKYSEAHRAYVFWGHVSAKTTAQVARKIRRLEGEV